MGRLSTVVLLREWGPPCQGPWHAVSLCGQGVVTVRPAITDAVLALDAVFRAFNYQTRRADTGAQNCRLITGGNIYSLHAVGIALDTNWQTNPYGPRLITDTSFAMQNAIKAIRTNSGAQVWGWGGDYSGNKDAMHHEIICTRQDIASGINSATVLGYGGSAPAPATAPAPTPSPAPNPPATAPAAPTGSLLRKSKKMLILVKTADNDTIYLTDGMFKRPLHSVGPWSDTAHWQLVIRLMGGDGETHVWPNIVLDAIPLEQ